MGLAATKKVLRQVRKPKSRPVSLRRIDPGHGTGRWIVQLGLEAEECIAAIEALDDVRFAGGVKDLIAVFQVRLQAPLGPDRVRALWVVVGVPIAFLFPNEAMDAPAAIRVYTARGRAWLTAWQGNLKKRPRTVFPFRVPWSKQGAAQMFSALTALDEGLQHVARGGRAWLGPDVCRRLRRVSQRTVRCGDLALSNRGELTVVGARVSQPEPSWLAIQRDARLRRAARSHWRKLYLLRGGVALAPEVLVRSLGRPHPLHIEIALCYANLARQEGLREALAATQGAGPRRPTRK